MKHEDSAIGKMTWNELLPCKKVREVVFLPIRL